MMPLTTFAQRFRIYRSSGRNRHRFAGIFRRVLTDPLDRERQFSINVTAFALH
jgi:hypothetical protein